jgi:hypothetical protein
MSATERQQLAQLVKAWGDLPATLKNAILTIAALMDENNNIAEIAIARGLFER